MTLEIWNSEDSCNPLSVPLGDTGTCRSRSCDDFFTVLKIDTKGDGIALRTDGSPLKWDQFAHAGKVLQ